MQKHKRMRGWDGLPKRTAPAARIAALEEENKDLRDYLDREQRNNERLTQTLKSISQIALSNLAG